MEVEATVARTIGPYEIAINVGQSSGVVTGQEVEIVDYYDVEDPDTGQALGRYRKVRANLKVTFVEDSFSVARMTDTRAKESASAFSGGSLSFSSSLVGGPPRELIPISAQGGVRIEKGDHAIISIDDG